MQGQTAYLKRSPVTFLKDEDCCRLGCAEFGTIGALNSESRTRGLTRRDCSLTERRELVDFVAHAPPGLINPNRNFIHWMLFKSEQALLSPTVLFS